MSFGLIGRLCTLGRDWWGWFVLLVCLLCGWFCLICFYVCDFLLKSWFVIAGVSL